MIANALFKKSEPNAVMAVIRKAVRWLDEKSGPVLWFRGISVLAAASGSWLSLREEPKHVAFAGYCFFIFALSESLLLLLAFMRRDSDFSIAHNKTKRFIDDVHASFLRGHGDLRVSLLLPWRDAEGRDYLKAFIRNGNHKLSGKHLRIDETNQKVDGIAGMAWLEGTHQSAFSDSDLSTQEGREAYIEDMNVGHAFLERKEGRHPKYVFAVVLRIDGINAGVLCIDGMASTTILGKVNDPMDSRLKDLASHTERLLSSHCELLSHSLLNHLYQSSGASDEN